MPDKRTLPRDPNGVLVWQTIDGIEPEAVAFLDVDEPIVLQVEHDPFFGEKDGSTFTSDPLTKPTWRQLFNTTCQAPAVTGDTHHIFFEDVDLSDKEYVEVDGVKCRVARPFLGS